MKKSKPRPTPDILLLGLVLGLLAFGGMMIYDASVVAATRDFGDRFYFVKEQLKWIGLGLFGLIVTLRIDYHLYRRLAVPIIVAALILLALVFVPGIGFSAYGADRWIDLKFLTVQPAEFAKLALAIFLAAWFESKENIGSFRHGLLPLLVILAILGILILRQPDLGTFVIIAATSLLVYYVAGARLLYYALGLPVVIATGLAIILTSAYRKARLLTFLDPSVDPQGQGYHVNQILLALGSGGFFGEGLGQGRGKYEYLPEVTTDSIFAVVGEELGFIGAVALIAAFSLLIYRGFKIVERAPDRFGMLLALGIILSFAIQVVLNLAAMAVLVPLTGVPLPLISYGGSSLIVTLTSMGILLNISRQRK